MKTPVVVTYSDNYKLLYDNFVSSAQPLALDIVPYKIDFGANADYGYLSSSFSTSCYSKVENVLKFLNESQAPFVISSDIDIQFFPNNKSLLDLLFVFTDKGLDWLGSTESSLSNREFNAGFYIIKNTQKMRSLLRNALQMLKGRRIMLDGVVINQLIFDTNYDIKYDFISEDFIKFGLRPIKNKDRLLLHHAVQVSSLTEKVMLLLQGKAEYLNLPCGTVSLDTQLV